MSFLDSMKSRFKSHEQQEEEEFERAFREGRFPEGVEDFQPLASTGHFVAVDARGDSYGDEYLPNPDEVMGSARRQADPFDAPAAPAHLEGGSQSYAAEYDSYGLYEQAPAGAGYADGPSSSPAPAARPAGQRRDPDDVQVFARGEGASPSQFSQPVTKPVPFADRLRERVAAANVSGREDESLGRSRATLEPVSDKVVRASAPVRPARRSESVRRDDLEAELAERRKARQAQEAAREAAHAAELARFAAARSAASPAGASEPAPVSRDAAPGRSGSVASHAASPAAERGKSAATVEPIRLPTTPIVLRPRLYDDVSSIASGVITKHQPVVLALRGTSADVTRRIMDFSFGLCCGTGAQMEQLEERVYVIMPRGVTIGDPDMAALRRQGILKG